MLLNSAFSHIKRNIKQFLIHFVLITWTFPYLYCLLSNEPILRGNLKTGFGGKPSTQHAFSFIYGYLEEFLINSGLNATFEHKVSQCATEYNALNYQITLEQSVLLEIILGVLHHLKTILSVSVCLESQEYNEGQNFFSETEKTQFMFMQIKSQFWKK